MIAPEPAAVSGAMPSVLELVKSGGPLMWPLGLCSVVAVAVTVERALALRDGKLGGERVASEVVTALEREGVDGARRECAKHPSSLSRVLDVALSLDPARRDEREKRVEDSATAEVKRLAANLKPLLLVYLVAPLLGLLGTVWGLIECFATIANQSALGRPDLLATGVYQALVTTAAGLTIAIPVLVAYTHFKNRIERFARRTEEAYARLDLQLAKSGGPRLLAPEVVRADP